MPLLLQVALLEGRRQQFLIFMAGITCTEREKKKRKKKGTKKKKITMKKKKKKRKILKEVKYQNFTCCLKTSVIASHIF